MFPVWQRTRYSHDNKKTARTATNKTYLQRRPNGHTTTAAAVAAATVAATAGAATVAAAALGAFDHVSASYLSANRLRLRLL